MALLFFFFFPPGCASRPAFDVRASESPKKHQKPGARCWCQGGNAAALVCEDMCQFALKSRFEITQFDRLTLRQKTFKSRLIRHSRKFTRRIAVNLHDSIMSEECHTHLVSLIKHHSLFGTGLLPSKTATEQSHYPTVPRYVPKRNV